MLMFNVKVSGHELTAYSGHDFFRKEAISPASGSLFCWLHITNARDRLSFVLVSSQYGFGPAHELAQTLTSLGIGFARPIRRR